MRKTISSIKGVVTKEKDDVSYERINNIDNLPFPDWEEMDISKYGGSIPIGQDWNCRYGPAAVVLFPVFLRKTFGKTQKTPFNRFNYK